MPLKVAHIVLGSFLELFKNHNIQNNEYRCFKFNQDSLFEKNIGPAFKIQEDYDLKLDNGYNSTNSEVIKIKVKKIKAVQKLKDNKFSAQLDYYMDNNTGIIYDIDLEFPIGKVYFDNDGIPEIQKKGVYIISEIISIPMLKHT